MGLKTYKLILALGCALCLSPVSALALELQAVLDQTSIAAPSRVGFREVRHNKMLKDDLVISGYLEYLENGTLRKVIEDPFQEAYLVGSDTIEIERDGAVETLSLKKSRSLRTMLGGIEAILAGDAEQISKVFHSELSGTEDGWLLQLRPRSKRIARQLQILTVTGNTDSIMSIRFDLKDGEWHEMEIEAKNPSP